MSQKRQPGVPSILPMQTAAAAIRQLVTRDPNMGQSAGPPGLGAEPILQHTPGGDIVQGVVHPAWSIIERLFRALPEESWFDPNVSPSSPVQFELGSFTVPANQEFWLFDYEFSVYRQSGIDPGDMVRAEDGRFSGVMGFDLTFGGRRLSDLLYQLDPVSVTLQRQSFDPPIGQRARQDQFDRAAAQSFASTASPGTSLLPVRPNVQGARHAPFTLIAGQGTRVSLSVVIFKTVQTPIVTIQGTMGGFLIHTQVSQSLLNRIRPR